MWSGEHHQWRQSSIPHPQRISLVVNPESLSSCLLPLAACASLFEPCRSCVGITALSTTSWAFLRGYGTLRMFLRNIIKHLELRRFTIDTLASIWIQHQVLVHIAIHIRDSAILDSPVLFPSWTANSDWLQEYLFSFDIWVWISAIRTNSDKFWKTAGWLHQPPQQRLAQFCLTFEIGILLSITLSIRCRWLVYPFKQ